MKRDPVITRRDEKLCAEVKHDQESGRTDNLSLILSLSIKELERMYTMEEESYLTTLLTLFDERWNSLSLDYQTMQETIK